VSEYDYVVVNDRLEECVERLRCIVEAERARWPRMAARAEAIAGSFRDPGPSA
jgi:guanylate kinase